MKTTQDHLAASSPEARADRIQELRELAAIQSREAASGDAYMVGLFNGLELALATLENREPKYQRTSDVTGTPAPKMRRRLTSDGNGGMCIVTESDPAPKEQA